MKNIVKCIGLFAMISFLMVACDKATIGGDEALDYGTSPIVTGFTTATDDFGVSVDGEVKIYHTKVQALGPNIENTTADVTLTYSLDETASTAVEGTHYLPLQTSSITLTAENNYVGTIPIRVLTENLEAPLTKTLVLNIDSMESVGEEIVLSGNTQQINITVNYLCFSDLAGTYTSDYSGGSYTVVVTKTGTGEYEAAPYVPLVESNGIAATFSFKVNCGVVTVTSLVGYSNTLTGGGIVNDDGSISFTDVVLSGGFAPASFTIIPN